VAELLKNLYNKTYINLLCAEFVDIDKNEFICKIFDESWKNRELKDRMRHISITLRKFLPQEYDKAIDVLKIIFLNMSKNYALENMIFQDFVEVYGLDNFKKSMEALECFTKDCSSEFAIRRFIVKYPVDCMKQMKAWAKSDNVHVRRLASEGCRPRLPWAISLSKFKKDPKEIFEILEILKDDKSEYVRRSVANNLNDISKDNPNLVKDITKNWIGKNQNRDKLLKHACRTLLKASDNETLNMFGFKRVKDVKISDFIHTKQVQENKELNFSFLIHAKENFGKLRIAYALYLLRKNQSYSKKVFKISEGICKQNSKRVSKSYSFKPISTRKYYKGKQKLEIIINGETLLQKEFFYL